MRRLLRTTRAGMTLLEVLLAVAITALMALALATVMTGVARGMTSSTDARGALQRAHAAYVRLRAYTDPGRCLLQHDAKRGFAVWLHDDKPGGLVNLREIRGFWFDQDRRVIEAERVEFPAEWPPAMQDTFDISLTRGADFLGALEQQRALGYTRRETIGDGIVSWSLMFPAFTPDESRRFRLVLELEAGPERTDQVLTAYAFADYLLPR